MFKITEKTKIYVVCPSYNKTGGTELAHQLVYEINKIKNIASIAYYPSEKQPFMINPAFEAYVADFIDINEIPDLTDHVIIFPEIEPLLVERFSCIQKAVWWMSVDNFKKRNGLLEFYRHFGLIKTIKGLIKGRIKIGGYKINKEIIHFYQSEYAHQYLMNNGVKNLFHLSDYINDSYLLTSPQVERINSVLYNPRKGISFTKKIMNMSPELNWIPLENMTTDEVKEILVKSKVYIDFGNHPGKDRFPREAAISGCCVITGKRGSANYYEDIPIPEEYKFNDTEDQINLIINRIKLCLSNYEQCQNDFNLYIEYIRNEHNIFKTDILRMLGNEDKNNV